jgi:hypothetical protein
MALRTQNCLVNVLKSDFGDFDEAMLHDVERTFERIFYILDIQKSVSDEVDEVFFNLAKSP